MRYFLVKQCHKSNSSLVLEESVTLRALLEKIEEILDDYKFSLQGESKPFYVRSSSIRNQYKNSEMWSYNNSYGVIIQTYADPTMFTLWNRKRTIGWLSNYWNDEKVFTLSVVSCHHSTLNYEYPDWDNKKERLPYLDELKNKRPELV